MKTNTVKSSEIFAYGKNPQGFSVFTCYYRGLGHFRTDSTGKAAKTAALAHFNREAQK